MGRVRERYVPFGFLTETCCRKSIPRNKINEAMKNTKVKQLFNNTILFGIGNFGSKILVLLLVPIYTASLTTSQYGFVDLVINIVNVLTPIFALSVYEAVFRDQLDGELDQFQKERAFFLAIEITLVSLVFYGLVLLVGANWLPRGMSYVVLLGLILVFLQNIQNLFGQYVRGSGHTVRYTLNGLITAGTLFVISVLLVYYWHMGVVGYICSIIFSVVVSILILGPATPRWRLTSVFKRISLSELKSMLRYSIPMIPNAIIWWLFNGVVRFGILFAVGVSANGLFAAAAKLPSIISVVVYIFTQAWELNAVQAAEEDDNQFYTLIINGFIIVEFTISLFLIMFSQPIGQIFIGGEFALGWRLIPGLLMANFWYGLATILGVNYMVSRKTSGLGLSTALGFIVTVIGLSIFLPLFKIYGAIIALNLGYFSMVVYRIIDTKEMMEIKHLQLAISAGVLLVATILVTNQNKFNMLENSSWFGLGMILVLLAYWRIIIKVFKEIIGFLNDRFL